MARVEERECTCDGCTCEINQTTLKETMCKLGFDAVLKDISKEENPVWQWSDTPELTPYDGVPSLTVAERPAAWHYVRYGGDTRCGDINVNETIAMSVATRVCHEYIRMYDTDKYQPRRSSRLKQKNMEKCRGLMDKMTGFMDPIQVHRQLGLGDQKMLYATMGCVGGSRDFIWNPPRKGEREIHYQLMTPPDWREHARRQ